MLRNYKITKGVLIVPRIRSDAVETATQKILYKIENYELKSGDIISDSEFAAEFGMSRTPVREAIMALIENGILERRRSKVVVSAITLSDIYEIIDLRDALEQKVVELIIEHGGLTSEQVTKLKQLQQNLQDNIANGDFDSTFQCDHMFHMALFKLAGNQRLINVQKNVVLQSQRLRWLVLLTPSRFVETYKEHQLILDALINKNISLAKEETHNHLIHTKENYSSILSSPQWVNIASEIQNMSE